MRLDSPMAPPSTTQQVVAFLECHQDCESTVKGNELVVHLLFSWRYCVSMPVAR